MTQDNPGKHQLSRRTLAKGAAWSVPVVATAVAAPAASASVVPGSSTVGPLNYTCNAVATTSNGGTIPQGPFTWTATITASTPTSVAPGDSIPAPTISAHVVTDANSANSLRAFGVQNITGGTSAAEYSTAGAIVNPGGRTGNLTVQPVAVPASGGIVTDASGSGAAETAGSSAGTINVTVGNFTAHLTTDSAVIVTVDATCTLDAGQDAVLQPPVQVK